MLIKLVQIGLKKSIFVPMYVLVYKPTYCKQSVKCPHMWLISLYVNIFSCMAIVMSSFIIDRLPRQLIPVFLRDNKGDLTKLLSTALLLSYVHMIIQNSLY